MSRLPVCLGPEFVAVFRTIRHEPDHQTGNHMVLHRQSGRCLIVPNIPRLAKSTPRAFVREAVLTKGQLIALL